MTKAYEWKNNSYSKGILIDDCSSTSRFGQTQNRLRNRVSLLNLKWIIYHRILLPRRKARNRWHCKHRQIIPLSWGSWIVIDTQYTAKRDCSPSFAGRAKYTRINWAAHGNTQAILSHYYHYYYKPRWKKESTSWASRLSTHLCATMVSWSPIHTWRSR